MVRKGDDKSTMFPLLWFHHISTLLAFFPFLAPTLLKCKDNNNKKFLQSNETLEAIKLH